METKETLKEIIQKANETKALQDKIIAEAEENLKKVVKRKLRPEYGEEYFSVDAQGNIYNNVFNADYDKNVWKVGNGFFTKEEAEKEITKRQAIQRVKDYLIENDLLCKKEINEWSISSIYQVSLNIKTGELFLEWYHTTKHYSPFGYLKSPNQQFLEDCKEDLLLIFG